MLMLPDRCADWFACARKVAEPEPEPVAPAVMLYQGTIVLAVQAHPGEVTTLMVPLPPAAGTLAPEPGPTV